METFEDILKVPPHYTGCYYNNCTKSIVFRAEGKYHRLDGPTIIYDNGQEQFFLDNVCYSKTDYWNNPKVAKYKLETILEL